MAAGTDRWSRYAVTAAVLGGTGDIPCFPAPTWRVAAAVGAASRRPAGRRPPRSSTGYGHRSGAGEGRDRGPRPGRTTMAVHRAASDRCAGHSPRPTVFRRPDSAIVSATGPSLSASGRVPRPGTPSAHRVIDQLREVHQQCPTIRAQRLTPPLRTRPPFHQVAHCPEAARPWRHIAAPCRNGFGSDRRKAKRRYTLTLLTSSQYRCSRQLIRRRTSRPEHRTPAGSAWLAGESCTGPLFAGLIVDPRRTRDREHYEKDAEQEGRAGTGQHGDP